VLEKGQGTSQTYYTYSELFMALIRRDKSSFLSVIKAKLLLEEALYYVKNREYS
jgi:hypothetical protein